jgi:IMP cyclohydrolase
MRATNDDHSTPRIAAITESEAAPYIGMSVAFYRDHVVGR